jgi:hypothetical protein
MINKQDINLAAKKVEYKTKKANMEGPPKTNPNCQRFQELEVTFAPKHACFDFVAG